MNFPARKLTFALTFAAGLLLLAACQQTVGPHPATVTAASTEPAPAPGNPEAPGALPPPPVSMGNIVGKPTHEWRYEWPDGLLPDSFAGFDVKANPLDGTYGNPGHTMNNLGRSLVLTQGSTTVGIECRRDYPTSKEQPSGEMVTLVFLQPVDFHALPAGMAARPHEKGVAMWFVFRIQDVVFDLRAGGPQEAACKAALLAAGEQIRAFYAPKPATQHSP